MKMEATYQPIKRGMTEAVTRDELEAAEREGREPVANVKQLTWFDANKGTTCLFGVLNGVVKSWYEKGRYSALSESDHDIFALPRYEWQWVTISPSGIYQSVTVHLQTEEDARTVAGIPDNWRVERIEGSKRLVKE
jgi:hypothetical protein